MFCCSCFVVLLLSLSCRSCCSSSSPSSVCPFSYPSSCPCPFPCLWSLLLPLLLPLLLLLPSFSLWPLLLPLPFSASTGSQRESQEDLGDGGFHHQEERATKTAASAAASTPWCEMQGERGAFPQLPFNYGTLVPALIPRGKPRKIWEMVALTTKSNKNSSISSSISSIIYTMV